MAKLPLSWGHQQEIALETYPAFPFTARNAAWRVTGVNKQTSQARKESSSQAPPPCCLSTGNSWMPLVKGGWQVLRGPGGFKSPAPPQPTSQAGAGQQKGEKGRPGPWVTPSGEWLHVGVGVGMGVGACPARTILSPRLANLSGLRGVKGPPKSIS